MESVNKRDYDTQQRRALAEQGKALPDGSFPIVDRADLANALQAIGRAGNRKMAEAHIRRRAEALDATDMLPDWITKSSTAAIPQADKLVLKALHNSALETMSLLEWIGVVKEVQNAGGIRNLDGYALTALEKAKQSFGGDRSAAGRYAAQQRWSKRTQTSEGAVATKNPAGAGEAMNMEMVGKTHDEAISAVGASTPTGKKLTEAKGKLEEAQKADKEGDAFGAWEKASQAAFDVEQVSQQRGAPSIVRRLSSMLQRLVSDLTDAFYAEEAA